MKKRKRKRKSVITVKAHRQRYCTSASQPKVWKNVKSYRRGITIL